ncbi:MAG: YCF48-related protein, partial [Pseudomonadota bacterium]
MRCLLLAAAVAWGSNTAAEPTRLPSIDSSLAPSSLLVDIARAGERLVAVGEYGHIVYSDDGGATWANARVPVSVMLTAVHFPTAERGFAVGHDGFVLATADAGESWRISVDSRRLAELQVAAAERSIARLQALLDATPDDDPEREDVVFEFENAEFDLEDAEALLDTGIKSPLLDVHFVDERNGFAAGGYGVLLQTATGGETWALISDRLDNPDRNHLYSLARSSAGDLFIAGEAGVLFRSADDGQSWSRLSAGYDGSLFGVVAGGDDALIAFGLRGRLFRSTDRGDTWSSVDSANRSTMMGGRRLADGRIALVGAGGAILVSVDDGRR